MTDPDYDIRIISHPLCPFARRLVFLLQANGWRRERDFRVQYVDLDDLPPWFRDLSPQGRMPVLELDGRVASDDTGAATAFLEEITELPRHPVTALGRIEIRTAVAEADRLLDRLKVVFTAKTEEELSAAEDALFGGLRVAEARLSGVLARESKSTMLHAAFGPFFDLVLFYPRLGEDVRWADVPVLRRWGEDLLTDPSFELSGCRDPERAFHRFFRAFGSEFAKDTQGAHA